MGWSKFAEFCKSGEIIMISSQKTATEHNNSCSKDTRLFSDALVLAQFPFHSENTRKQRHGTYCENKPLRRARYCDIVDVTFESADALAIPWRPTSDRFSRSTNLQKVRIIYDDLKWLSIAHLVLSRVEYIHQFERITCPQMRVLNTGLKQSGNSAGPFRASSWLLCTSTF